MNRRRATHGMAVVFEGVRPPTTRAIGLPAAKPAKKGKKQEIQARRRSRRQRKRRS